VIGLIPNTADVVIIGSGAAGLSTAYYLAQKGVTDLVIFERDRQAGGHSTGRCAGGFRHQFATRINVELSKLSMNLFAGLAEETGCAFDLNFCGYLFGLTVRDDLDAFEAAVALQRESGIAAQWLTAREVREMLPRVRLDDLVAGTYYGRDGLIGVDGVIKGWLGAIKRAGIRLFENTAVVDIGAHNGKIIYVDTTQGRIDTPAVVNAAGPWAGQIGKMVRADLPVKPVMQQLLVTSAIQWMTKDFPVVILPAEGLGLHREGNGLLTGLHRTEDSGGDTPEVDIDWENRHCEQLLKRIPALEETEVESSWAGFYAITPDLHPILGEVPFVKGFFCINGFSGHGFMHSPACGLLLSEVILDGKAHSLDIAPLRIERFYRGENAIEFYQI
jgi:sarcosine oxidase subunit beta